MSVASCIIFLIINRLIFFLKDSFTCTMFGDLFEEDFSFISNDHCGRGKKSKLRDSEPPAPRDFTNISGIKNQGGTCYLNSLLQTLLFTPEFRGKVFKIFLMLEFLFYSDLHFYLLIKEKL